MRISPETVLFHPETGDVEPFHAEARGHLRKLLCELRTGLAQVRELGVVEGEESGIHPGLGSGRPSRARGGPRARAARGPGQGVADGSYPHHYFDFFVLSQLPTIGDCALPSFFWGL
jgi:hypothetical protein